MTRSSTSEIDYRTQQSFLKDYWWSPRFVLKHQLLSKAIQLENGFLQVDYSLKTKYNYDLTNKFTLNKSAGCLRLNEVKTKE